MDDETKEAISEAVTSLLRDSDIPVRQRMRQAFLIRAHVARETGPNSAAATVVDMLAWLRAGQAAGDDLDNHAYGWAADAFEAGEHVGAAKGGDDDEA